jgi:hypothetical protein
MAVVSRSRKTPDRPQCPAINAQVAATILSLKPATVILAAEWGLYPDRSPVARTIRLLRDDSVQRIVLIGPVPSWTHALPQVLVMAFNQDPLHRIPTRTSLDLVPDVRSIDTEMRDFAERMDIVYVSPLDILCDRNGCVTRADDQNQELVTWDDTHLTAAGSDIVMKAAARELFGDEETGGGRNTVPR